MLFTEPNFFRRFDFYVPIQFSLKNKVKAGSISEPVSISIGLKGPVDKESGMVINLGIVDSWIEEFKKKTNKKEFKNRWHFCKMARDYFFKIQNFESHNFEVRFAFHDFFIHDLGFETNFGWNIFCQIRSKDWSWMSPSTLTLTSNSKKYLQLNLFPDPVIKKKFNKINLAKMIGDKEKFLDSILGSSFQSKGVAFKSFEYFDPVLGAKIRLEL